MKKTAMINLVISRRAALRPLRFSLPLILTLFAAASAVCWAQSPQTSSPVSLHGAGSTFAAPLYTKWIEEYGVAHRDVSISYDAVGSGEGVRRHGKAQGRTNQRPPVSRRRVMSRRLPIPQLA